jgi:hypothetical protein
MEALLRDPITHDHLQEPVLASDGHTYSLDALRAAMAGDVLHRSPVTQEVLRRHAYSNVVARQLLADSGSAGGTVDGGTVEQFSLWDDGMAPALASTAAWEGAVLQTLTVVVPVCMSPLLAAALVKLGMDKLGAPLSLTVHTHHDGSAGTQTLMHPPPPEQAWDACVELCTATFGKHAFKNPWCISGAIVGKGGGHDRSASAPILTVESCWLAAWSK